MYEKLSFILFYSLLDASLEEGEQKSKKSGKQLCWIFCLEGCIILTIIAEFVINCCQSEYRFNHLCMWVWSVQTWSENLKEDGTWTEESWYKVSWLKREVPGVLKLLLWEI